MTREQILRYVPKSKIEAISDAWQDDDGIWITLKDGWNAERMDRGCHTIHEDTIQQLRYQIAGIKRESEEKPHMEFVYSNYRVKGTQDQSGKCPTDVKMYDMKNNAWLTFEDDETFTAWITAEHIKNAIEANYYDLEDFEFHGIFVKCLLRGYRQRMQAERENPEIGIRY